MMQGDIWQMYRKPVDYLVPTSSVSDLVPFVLPQFFGGPGNARFPPPDAHQCYKTIHALTGVGRFNTDIEMTFHVAAGGLR